MHKLISNPLQYPAVELHFRGCSKTQRMLIVVHEYSARAGRPSERVLATDKLNACQQPSTIVPEIYNVPTYILT